MSPRRVVLLVEDDRPLRELFAFSLRSAGYDVHVAADGLEALHLIEGTDPNVIVLDLVLPRVSGVDVLADLAGNAATRGIPIVVVTGSDVPTEYANVRCRLQKPIDITEFLSTVERCLDNRALHFHTLLDN